LTLGEGVGEKLYSCAGIFVLNVTKTVETARRSALSQKRRGKKRNHRSGGIFFMNQTVLGPQTGPKHIAIKKLSLEIYRGEFSVRKKKKGGYALGSGLTLDKTI